MEMRLSSTKSMPFTYGINNVLTTKSNIPSLGCIQNQAAQVNQANNDSEDDFPVCQAPLTKPIITPFSTQCMQQQQQQPQPQPQPIKFSQSMQFGQMKSNQMIFNHLKNMRAQVEQNNMMIDSLYQILSQPHELNVKQLEQIYTQISTLRNNVSDNNNSISEIYKIISNHI